MSYEAVLEQVKRLNEKRQPKLEMGCTYYYVPSGEEKHHVEYNIALEHWQLEFKDVTELAKFINKWENFTRDVDFI